MIKKMTLPYYLSQLISRIAVYKNKLKGFIKTWPDMVMLTEKNWLIYYHYIF